LIEETTMSEPQAPAAVKRAVSDALREVRLSDKYLLTQGQSFMSGVQALVRLPLVQHLRDRQAGHNTGGFISGYRGSPLGSYDQSLQAAHETLQAHQVHFQPGVNEELAATAVWGSQQLDLYPQQQTCDGVFGIWYGKGPGVDRSTDAFKHANMAGTARLGGVLAVAGDDHVSKSSTVAHQSDHVFMACGMPVFFPSTVQDILDMGVHALAMSRFCGLWSGMKTIQEVVESSATVDVAIDRVQVVLPEDVRWPEGGVHIRWPDTALEQEARMMRFKWPAALAYVRANRLNFNVIESPQDRLGLMASGKAYNDTRQALADLGLDEASCRALGIRLHKVNVVWPLEPELARGFAQGLEEILVVEEKRAVMEPQLKDALFAWPDGQRPRVLGKWEDEAASQPLLRSHADLTPGLVARAIAKRLQLLGVPADVAQRLDAHIAMLDAREALLAQPGTTALERTPWFCSGCPHNTSTKVPEGSRALAGIGCHYMSLWMDRSTTTFSQMGGEGAAWVGQQPFCRDRHVFANLGDGTYFHSGLLAIRQAIAAGVNITYKILYNDAVAMTGGQAIGERPEGHSVLQIMGSLVAEGVHQLVIVTDEPDKYQGAALAPGVRVEHRDQLDVVQRHMREVPGTTAIIYDQTCATEKRRRRKRGTLAEPGRRVIINPLVCEGCGDCSDQSNCLSVEPLETEWGRKRSINQSTCNKDFSCLKGFCPSFVTVLGGQLRKPERRGHDLSQWPCLPEPTLPSIERAWGVVVAGVGGTGVITVGQVLGMAAHLQGQAVVVQDAGGLAQKGGATWSHVQIADQAGKLYTSKVDVGSADLVLGCDAIVGASAATRQVMQAGRTLVVLNSHHTPTAAFVHKPDWHYPEGQCEAAIGALVGEQGLEVFDAERLARELLGDSMYTNALMMGYAWQKGRLPMSRQAIERAFELNGVQVANNQAAFHWGRHCAHDLPAVLASLSPQQVVQWHRKPSLEQLLTQRVQALGDYQNAAYAQAYQALVQRVSQLEQAWQRSSMSEAVARNLYKLMAYKDEYEVARLHSHGALQAQVEALFEGPVRLQFHLAPPLLAARNAQGELTKRPYGSWMMRAFGLLARFKGLRGTPLDVFGYTHERRAERALIGQYRATVEQVLLALAAGPQAPGAAQRYERALALLQLPDQIRGFGHVKARNLARVQAQWAQLQAELVSA
jgi:indolepyruvate ferredoxin oxidoreductase